MLTSTSTHPAGENALSKLEWDLDGDGQYDDASGKTAKLTFDAPGAHTVGLSVTDQQGDTSVSGHAADRQAAQPARGPDRTRRRVAGPDRHAPCGDRGCRRASEADRQTQGQAQAVQDACVQAQAGARGMPDQTAQGGPDAMCSGGPRAAQGAPDEALVEHRLRQGWRISASSDRAAALEVTRSSASGRSGQARRFACERRRRPSRTRSPKLRSAISSRKPLGSRPAIASSTGTPPICASGGVIRDRRRWSCPRSRLFVVQQQPRVDRGVARLREGERPDVFVGVEQLDLTDSVLSRSSPGSIRKSMFTSSCLMHLAHSRGLSG